jgi:3-mercaptopyruvate sulfurtransferase SseA
VLWISRDKKVDGDICAVFVPLLGTEYGNRNKRKNNTQQNINHENPIVSVDWLHEHLQDPINYSRCHFGNADRGYPNKARTFDIKTKFSDTNSPLPNTVPNSEAFATACRKMGIQAKIVVL